MTKTSAVLDQTVADANQFDQIDASGTQDASLTASDAMDSSELAADLEQILGSADTDSDDDDGDDSPLGDGLVDSGDPDDGADLP